MKRSIAILFNTFIAIAVTGQVLTYSASPAASGSADDGEIIVSGFIYNNSNDTVAARWYRMENVPSGWSTAVCDNIQCWVETVNTSPQPFYIPPNGQSVLDVNFYPNGISGNGSVTVRTWVEGDSANTVAVSSPKTATALEAVGVNFSKENEKIRVYPNPARDYFLIKNLPVGEVSTVEVYNIFGRKMLSFSQAASKNNSSVQKFDVASLAKGIYMVRIFDAGMNVIFTKSLSKE